MLIGQHRKVSPRLCSLASASICYLSSMAEFILEPVDMSAMQLNSGQHLMAKLRLSLLLIRTILTKVTPVERMQMTGFWLCQQPFLLIYPATAKTHTHIAQMAKQICNAYQEQTNKHTHTHKKEQTSQYRNALIEVLMLTQTRSNKYIHCRPCRSQE